MEQEIIDLCAANGVNFHPKNGMVWFISHPDNDELKIGLVHVKYFDTALKTLKHELERALLCKHL